MAASLRFAARKISSRAPERPAQRLFSAAASAVAKEEQWMLLPRISHGGSSLRLFSSSEAPSLLNNNNNKVFTQFLWLGQFAQETKLLVI
jgi:hypothetical protein